MSYKHFIAGAFALALIVPAATQAMVAGTSSPLGGIVGQWNFDESSGTSILDSSGYSNTGTLENGATRYIGTQQGSKLELDGVDDRAMVYPTSAAMNGLQDVTVMGWIRPTENGGIMLRKGSTDVGRFSAGINFEGKLYFRAGHTGASGTWQSTNTLPLNEWSHVAVAYSFSSTANQPQLYIDGVAQSIMQSKAPEGTPIADTAYLYFGNNHDFVNRAVSGFDSAFEGRMDIVRIYNRMLSATEVDSAYKTGQTSFTDGYNPGGGNSTPPSAQPPYTPYPATQLPDGTWVQPLGAGNASATAQCLNVARNLYLGLKGDDVRSLQQHLRSTGDFTYPEITGYYGSVTVQAVQRFQCRTMGICNGTTDGNGYGVVGPKTRAQLSKLCTGAGQSTGTQTSSQTTDISSLTAQISALLELVASLQAQLAASQGQ